MGYRIPLDSFCAHNPVTAWLVEGSADIILSRRDLFPFLDSWSKVIIDGPRRTSKAA